MNSKLLSIIVVILAIVISNAHAGDTSYGVKFGMMLSNISNTPEEWDDNTSFKAGFTGGVYFNYSVNENISVQPELLYVQKGVKSNLYEGLTPIDIKASFDYVELPFLIMYTFTGTGTFKPFLYGGPSVAYNLSSELEVSAFILSASVDMSSLSHTTDFLLLAGGGFDIALGNGTLIVDARFQYGFTNVIQTGDFEINESPHTVSVDDFKNYGFILMVGYGL